MKFGSQEFTQEEGWTCVACYYWSDGKYFIGRALCRNNDNISKILGGKALQASIVLSEGTAVYSSFMEREYVSVPRTNLILIN